MLNADILEFSKEEENWTRGGEIAHPRSEHAVSIADLDDFKLHFQYKPLQGMTPTPTTQKECYLF